MEPQAGSAPADFKRSRRKKMDLADPNRVDRLPPHSVEAEQGVLGCVLLSPPDCLGECIEKFKTGSDVFYDLRHRAIYELLVEMYERKDAIDIITVQQALKDRQQLETVGGLPYLASFPMRCRRRRTSPITWRLFGRNSSCAV
jgi:replicative DNA helicase